MRLTFLKKVALPMDSDLDKSVLLAIVVKKVSMIEIDCSSKRML